MIFLIAFTMSMLVKTCLYLFLFPNYIFDRGLDVWLWLNPTCSLLQPRLRDAARRVRQPFLELSVLTPPVLQFRLAELEQFTDLGDLAVPLNELTLHSFMTLRAFHDAPCAF